jgi:hypothetical protein
MKIAGEYGDIVPGNQRLLEQMFAGAPGGAEKSEPHNGCLPA